jgi:hypothetical protein
MQSGCTLTLFNYHYWFYIHHFFHCRINLGTMAGGALDLWHEWVIQIHPLDLWNEWATQILVLLSFTLQVVLHVFAKVRRRKASLIIQRLLLWLVYQLSDSTATYAAGQLFFSSTPQDHHLVAFWAPFLLLHLGGPDNITAYALEDSKLWKRHFLSLVVQVLGAGYVLYKHIAGSGVLLMLAAILMSLVGVAKYVERTWALWCANFSSLQSSLKAMERDKHHQHFYTEHQDDMEGSDGELLLQRAHSLFHICKRGIVDSVIEVDYSDATIIRGLMENRERMWTVMEMELSLMYDILYTKDQGKRDPLLAWLLHPCHLSSCRCRLTRVVPVERQQWC